MNFKRIVNGITYEAFPASGCKGCVAHTLYDNPLCLILRAGDANNSCSALDPETKKTYQFRIFQEEKQTMNEINYLNGVSITRLASAARMAGLKWKSGDPEYNKAGIIRQLEMCPSVMRACIATLQRMDSQTPSSASQNNSLSDLLDDDYTPPAPAAHPSQPIPSTGGSVTFDAAQFQTLQRNIAGMAQKLNGIEDGANKVNIAPLNGQIAIIQSSMQTLAADIAKLQERAPIDLHIPALPVIKLTGSEHKSYKKLLTYLYVNRRVILTGSAGTGKSMAVKNAAEHFKVAFHLQTPVTMDYQYLGHRDAQGVFHETPTFKAYTQGGLLLWDEADAGLPDAMLAANPIFDGNGFAVFGDGKMYAQHPDFMAVFNMNTDGNGSTMQYAGRNRLDGATLARFGVRIHWEIDPAIERQMALGFDKWYSAVLAVRAFMEQRQIVDVNATPRHTKTGAMLLRAECDRSSVLVDVLKSGALAETWQSIESLPAVRSFLQGA